MTTDRHKTGADRQQLLALPPLLEELVPPDSTARVIEAFVDSLDLEQLGFFHTTTARTGAPPYHPGDMLKLYLYGYLNRTRSTRQLEQLCRVNVEVMWLLGGLKPANRTIAYFRAHHPKALRKVFSELVKRCVALKLIDTELLSIDGSKFRAVNSKKNNHNPEKINRHLEYIDQKINKYLQQLDDNDRRETNSNGLSNKEIKEKLEVLRQRQDDYFDKENQLRESGDTQLSTTDPDSRHLVIRRNITEVSYNVQTATEAKNKLVVHCQATNQNDRKALFTQAMAAKEAIGAGAVEVLADKGYHNGEEIHRCSKEGITTYVAPQEPATSKSVPTRDYRSDQFTYHPETDTYTCPQGQVMTTTGKVYTKHSRRDTKSYVKQYKTKACTTCPARHLCTTAPQPRGRLIERSIYQQAVDANNQRVVNNIDKYRLRQTINEHVFGTVKRAWGFDHLLLKGLAKVNGEAALLFTAYNLRRLMSILGQHGLIETLKGLLRIIFRLRRITVQVMTQSIPPHPGRTREPHITNDHNSLTFV